MMCAVEYTLPRPRELRRGPISGSTRSNHAGAAPLATGEWVPGSQRNPAQASVDNPASPHLARLPGAVARSRLAWLGPIPMARSVHRRSQNPVAPFRCLQSRISQWIRRAARQQLDVTCCSFRNHQLLSSWRHSGSRWTRWSSSRQGRLGADQRHPFLRPGALHQLQFDRAERRHGQQLEPTVTADPVHKPVPARILTSDRHIPAWRGDLAGVAADSRTGSACRSTSASWA